MAYQHGVRVLEQETSVIAPILGTAGLQVVFGTAPVNMAEDPSAVVNTPVIAYSWAEAVSKLGYSDDWNSYTLCQSMYATFKQFNVAPIIFINVLDPAVHKTSVATPAQVNISNKQGTLAVTGVIPSSVVVKKTSSTEAALVLDTDYTLSFDSTGNLVITLLDGGSAATSTSVYVTAYDKLNPAAVTANDIVGVSTGNTEKGLEVLRQVYPKLGMTPGLLSAPGWSHLATVGTALAAKCEEINGYFRCEAFVDINSASSGGCSAYDDVKTYKDNAGTTSPHVMALWPCVAVGDKKFYYSAITSALTAYTDATNDDVPNLSPGNRSIGATAAVLSDAVASVDSSGNVTWDKEVSLDQIQGNTVNGFGVTTLINLNGFRSWGNNSAAYPNTTDPKDRWFCCRRFFSWWGNSFILTYFQKVDRPASTQLIESIVDSENIRGNAYVATGKCAGARIEFNSAENPVTDLLNGKITFHQHLAPWTPAEDIVDILEFDPDTLAAALTGG